MGDRWTYDENELENARRDKYIFGGEITRIEEEEKIEPYHSDRVLSY